MSEGRSECPRIVTVPTNNYFVYPFLHTVVSEITFSLIFTQKCENVTPTVGSPYCR